MTQPYPLRALVAFDVFCNVILGGRPDETISARPGWLGEYRRMCSHIAKAEGKQTDPPTQAEKTRQNS